MLQCCARGGIRDHADAAARPDIAREACHTRARDLRFHRNLLRLITCIIELHDEFFFAIHSQSARRRAIERSRWKLALPMAPM